MEEAPAVVLKGVDLHGVCLFPAVAMPNRRSGEWLHNGICDLVEESGRLKRTPFRPYTIAHGLEPIGQNAETSCWPPLRWCRGIQRMNARVLIIGRWYYVDELRRWQRRLDRVTELDEDPSSDPVDLADIEVAAERKGPTSEGLAQVMGATASGPLGFR